MHVEVTEASHVLFTGSEKGSYPGTRSSNTFPNADISVITAIPQGLGTSSPKEAKEYFAALETHQLEFEWKDDLKDADLIDMAFSKKRGA